VSDQDDVAAGTRGGMTLLQLDPSAQRPWTRIIVGFADADPDVNRERSLKIIILVSGPFISDLRWMI
jgi:hypothetical protein